MVTNQEMIAIVVFFLVWIIILIPIFIVGKKFDNRKPKSKTVDVPSDIKEATNKHKALFMRRYVPDGMDPRSQKCAETKLQICQNLFTSMGKITGIKSEPDGITEISIKTGGINIKISNTLPKSAKVGDSVIVYYEKGLSGIPHYVTVILSSELSKLTRTPAGANAVKPAQN